MASSYTRIVDEERSSTETLRPGTLQDSKIAEPLLGEDENEELEYHTDAKHFIRTQEWIKPKFSWICLLLNVLLFMCAIGFYFFKYATVATDAACQSKLWAANPIEEAMEFEWRQYDSGLIPPDLYGIPTQQSRELWAKMYNDGTIAFPYDELERINKSTKAFDWWTRPPPFDDEVVAILEMAHQYHCVSLLWWFQYRHQWDFESVLNMTEHDFRLHTNHCNLALMTIIKCQADMTPVLFQKDPSNRGTWKPSDAPHRCKKFDKLTEWQGDHSICNINCQPEDLL